MCIESNNEGGIKIRGMKIISTISPLLKAGVEVRASSKSKI